LDGPPFLEKEPSRALFSCPDWISKVRGFLRKPQSVRFVPESPPLKKEVLNDFFFCFVFY